jgi:hypothetical protein
MGVVGKLAQMLEKLGWSQDDEKSKGGDALFNAKAAGAGYAGNCDCSKFASSSGHSGLTGWFDSKNKTNFNQGGFHSDKSEPASFADRM